MANSSDGDMKEVFEYLANIKKAMPSNNIYIKTTNSIKRQEVIPILWAKVAACLLISFIASEIYLSSKIYNSHKNDISVLISRTNNNLYNE